jgi:hypothetical protein
MWKYSRIQHQTKKARLLPNNSASISLIWMPTMLAVAIVALMIGVWVIGHGQTSMANTTKTTIEPAMTATSIVLPVNRTTNGSQQTTGVFPLGFGGPIPIPANVLHPTNIARLVRKEEITTIYAGSLTQTPTTGVLAVLQENLTTGQQSLHLYRTTQPVQALTILSIHQDMLMLSSPTTRGSFDLVRDQFHFS